MDTFRWAEASTPVSDSLQPGCKHFKFKYLPIVFIVHGLLATGDMNPYFIEKYGFN